MSSIKQITNKPLGEFDTPIDFQTTNQDIIASQFEIIDKTNGDKINSIPIFNIIDVKRQKETLNYGVQGVKEVDQVHVLTDVGEFLFGAKEIQESMAYLIQRSCCSKLPKHDQYPYHTASKIATYLCPSFAGSRRKLVALCEMSLMSSNPGSIFVHGLELIQKGELHFPTVSSIYDYYLKGPAQFSNEPNRLCLREGYNKINSYALDHLHEVFKGVAQYSELNDWIEKVLIIGGELLGSRQHLHQKSQ